MFDLFYTKQSLFYLQNIGFFLFLVLLSAILTYICRRYIRIMDYASIRSMHVGAIPRSGGIAIVITFCIGILIYYFIHNSYFVGQSAFWGLFLSSLMVSVVNLYDDIRSNGFVYKFLIQFIGVAVLIGFDLTLNEWTIPYIGKIPLGAFRYILTVLWIVGITNAFNFMDGLNGLAAGTAVIVSLAFAFITLNTGSGVSFHISYIIAASCIGFIFYNFPKASMFMGDVGSAFLGFSFGAIAILAAHYDAYHTPFLVMPILLANFILETLFTFGWRLIHHYPVFEAHKMHPYQLLKQMGVSSQKIAFIYYAQSISLVGLCFLYLNYYNNVFNILVLLLIFIVYFVYFMFIHKVAKIRGVI